MNELIRRSLRLWQKARRLDAPREDLAAAAAVVPELCAALDAARAEVEDASRRSGARAEDEVERFGRYVAHEVRNRLNLVELSIERAAVLSADPEVRAALEPVRTAFRHLSAVADDLRATISPPGSTDGSGPSGPRLPLSRVVRELLDTSQALARERGIRLEMGDGCPDAEVDAARVELILVNLLTNALRYPDGDKDEHWVRVEARWHDGEEGVLEIGVRDNGVGIAADQRAKLFEDSSHESEGHRGPNGMGLAIVRQAVERAGGRVWAQSDEGVGTAIFFTLPVGERRCPEARGGTGAAEAGKPAPPAAS